MIMKCCWSNLTQSICVLSNWRVGVNYEFVIDFGWAVFVFFEFKRFLFANKTCFNEGSRFWSRLLYNGNSSKSPHSHSDHQYMAYLQQILFDLLHYPISNSEYKKFLPHKIDISSITMSTKAWLMSFQAKFREKYLHFVLLIYKEWKNIYPS